MTVQTMGFSLHCGHSSLKFFAFNLMHVCFIPCRAPVLVALAMIECGMKYEDAVQFIRQ